LVQLSVCSSARALALAGITWTTAMAGPLLPQFLSRSTTRQVLRRRPLLLSMKAQFSMPHSYLVYPATHNRQSTRDALRVTAAENTNLTVQLPRPRGLDVAEWILPFPRSDEGNARIGAGIRNRLTVGDIGARGPDLRPCF
jgi:hypothetical protein